MLIKTIGLCYLLLFLYSTNLSAKDTLVFAPLPTKDFEELVKDLLPMANYIEQHSDIKIEFQRQEDYAQIIKKFSNNEIDIVLLGPLPYAKLAQQYKFAQPFIGFKQSNGNPYYKCVLVKYAGDKLDLSKKLRVALTQPLSTCGYFMTQKLLHSKYNLELSQQNFDYTMSHENVLHAILDGEFDIGGVKQSSAESYKSLGIEVLDQSVDLPNFSLIANTKTVTPQQIRELQEIFLSIPSATYKQWSGISSNGFIKTDKSSYELFKIDFSTIPLSGDMQ